MKSSELRVRTEKEIIAVIAELSKAQFSARLQLATQQLSDNSQLGKIKKDIARAKTILGEIRRGKIV